MAQERAHEEGQQHPIKLYLVVWGWLFVLSTCSYLVDYFGLAGISQMVSDPAVHGCEGRLDRRYFHAHGVGAASPDVCHSGPAGRGVTVCGDHGVRIGLHALHSGHIFRNGER